ncbi:MAG TPA: GspH/FimT family pseudopilin [Candidatus Binatia bacterium]|nr:GspH/FimT family pseudopilin [Candidatus Binatia bacterium]
MKPAHGAGFTLLEMMLALFVAGLLVALIVPRLGVLRGAALESSARQVANRIRFLREEAALRGQYVRFEVDPESGRYAASVLLGAEPGSSTPARFVAKDTPLYRATSLPRSVGIDLVGPGVVRTAEGYPSTLFTPDGYADPSVVYLDDGAGSAFTILIEAAVSQPRVFDRRVDARELIAP